MKKLVLFLLTLLMLTPLYAGKKKESYSIPDALTQEIKAWPKDQLEYLASVYLELGKQFYTLASEKKKGSEKYQKDSKACFFYAIQVYPIGPSALEAKKILKENWEIIIP
ncbi:MAG TPA: hypothetical protein DHW82_12645 [Spirochaetia bacterium]|nr:MAG: hypothetical protein A2Y41_04115 [Spirochaetes bacterium GWB1_36_13]HCL57838.1 hypothetical protein [Spirochaetia bacterium]